MRSCIFSWAYSLDIGKPDELWKSEVAFSFYVVGFFFPPQEQFCQIAIFCVTFHKGSTAPIRRFDKFAYSQMFA